MKKYSDILKKTKMNKSKKYKIPYGWVLLKKSDNNSILVDQNKDDYSIEYIEEMLEQNRQYELYLKNITRLLNYKIDEYEKENIDYCVEEILEELGYYDDESEEVINCEEIQENSDYEYSD